MSRRRRKVKEKKTVWRKGRGRKEKKYSGKVEKRREGQE